MACAAAEGRGLRGQRGRPSSSARGGSSARADYGARHMVAGGMHYASFGGPGRAARRWLAAGKRDGGRGRALAGFAVRTLLLACGLAGVATMAARALGGEVGVGRAGTGKNIVLYLACNADGMLGATVSARSALAKGMLADVGVLAVRDYMAQNDTALFESLSPNARVFWVDELHNPAAEKMTADDVQNAKQCRYSKIHAWDLEQYDRVLLLDTDTFVLANLDPCFEHKREEGLLAARDSVGDIFNTGVMLLRPDKALAKRMLTSKDTVKSYNKGDQGFFNAFFGDDWVQLPSKYNVPIHSIDSAYVRAGLPESVAVLHFTAEVKPWNFFRASAVKTGWKTGKTPWVWYALWHQMADFNNERHEECFSQKTLSSLSRTKNESNFAVMISTYDRPVESLAKVVQMFESVPEANEIIIVAHKVGRTLDTHLLQKATTKKLRVLYQKTDSLNNRFFARLAFNQAAVYVCDDDIWLPPEDLSFAHSIFRQHKEQIVGFFPRFHRPDGTYEYNGSRTTYSLMLTKGMFIAPEYLFAYTCLAPKRSLEMVEKIINCEDVLMNFVITGISGKAPVTVKTTRPILDWGTKSGISGAGLAAKTNSDNTHLVSRTGCIQEFRKHFDSVDLLHSSVAYSRFLTNKVIKASSPPE